MANYKRNDYNPKLFGTYLKEIGSIPMLTEEEEYNLAMEVYNNTSNASYARDRLVNSNLKLVVSEAKKFETSLPLTDLISEGNLGLIHAVSKFDPTLGNKLSTYAVPWIKQYIQRFIMDSSKEIRLPQHIQEDLSKINKAKVKLFEDGIVNPSIEMLATATSIPAKRISEINSYIYSYVSLNNMINDDDDTCYSEIIADDSKTSFDKTYENHLSRNIESTMKRLLTENEYKVISYRFALFNNEKMSLDEVGKVLNITREGIRQIEKKALRKLASSNDLQAFYNFSFN